MTSVLIELAALQHFHFMRPYWLLLLLPIIWLLRSFKARDDSLATWRQLMSVQMLEHLTVAGSSSQLFNPRNVTWLASLLIILVLAGPSWSQQSSPFTEDQSALIIALDVSETMQQSDVQPSRLLRAKQKIVELLAMRGDSNTSLIAFAGSAHIVMPITNDREMIRHFLDALDPTMMPEPGKLPQNVLPLAGALLEPTSVPGTLLIIGDGATSEAASQFAEFFDQQQHQLIVLAIGDSSRIDAVDTDSNLIPLQLAQLEALTDQSNGRLVTMTHDKQDINRVNRYIDNHLAIVEDDSRPWHDAGYPLVFIIAASLLLWFRRGWTLTW